MKVGIGNGRIGIGHLIIWVLDSPVPIKGKDFAKPDFFLSFFKVRDYKSITAHFSSTLFKMSLLMSFTDMMDYFQEFLSHFRTLSTAQ